MAVIIKNGTVIYNQGKTSAAITADDGVQHFPDDVEAYLVSEGIAQYVDKATPRRESLAKGVATAQKQSNDEKPGDNIPDEDKSSKGELDAQPSYSVDMKSAELRELMNDCGIPYKVGMSKADMVAALDEYFGEETDDDTPPDLGVENPIL